MGVALLVALTGPPPALVGSLETPGVGARASAMGSAYTAVSDTLSAVYYNPAGLTQLLGDGRAVDQEADVRFFIPSVTVDQDVVSDLSRASPGGTANDGFSEASAIPSFRAGFELTDWLYVAPFSFVTPFAAYGRFSETEGDQRFNMYEADQIFVNYAPRVAVKLTDWLSVGGGIDVQAFNKVTRLSRLGDGFVLGGAAQFLGVSTEQLGALLGVIGVAPNGEDDGKLLIRTDEEMPTGLWPVNDLDSNWRDWGYTVGVLVEPTEWLRLGATYRSEIRIGLEGTGRIVLFDDPVTELLDEIGRSPLGPILGFTGAMDDVERMEFTFTTPRQIAGGVAVDVLDRWTLSADLVFTGWKDARRRDVLHFGGDGLGPTIFDLDNDPATPPTGATVVVIPREQRDTLSFRVGTEIALTDAVRLRLGYVLDPHPQGDRFSAIDTGVNDRDIYTVGLAAVGLFDGLLDLSATVQHVVWHKRRVAVGESRILGGSQRIFDPVLEGQAANEDFALTLDGTFTVVNLEVALRF